jgi:zinc protease
MEGQANHLASWEALGDWALGDRYMERLLTATAEEVSEAVRRHLDPTEASIVVYRPERGGALAADAAAMRRLLAGARPQPLPPTPPRVAEAPAVLSGAPAVEREEGAVRVYRTPGDVPVLVRRKPGSPIVHAGVLAVGGVSEEGAERGGLTMLLARSAVKGTERRTATQIAEDSEMLGGGIGASVGSESFGWTTSVPAKNTPAALELLADVVQHATIPEEALETERAIALADLAALRDDMFRYPVRLALEAAFDGHPYGASTVGTEASLRGITADELRAWHHSRVLHAPAVIAVVGDVDSDEAAALVARSFERLRMAEPAPLAAPGWPGEVTVSAESREKAQTALALLFPGPARADDDRFAAQLLAGVASGLGGRFFDELRDRQSLAYTVHASATERRLAGLFASYIATSPEKEGVARDGLLAEFAKLREQPVTDEELARAKTYAIGTHAIRQESGAAVLGDLVDAWLFGHGLAELDEHDDRVRAVTPAAIQALARNYFDESRRVEGIVRGVGRTV